MWPLSSTSSMPFSLPSDGRAPNKTKQKPNEQLTCHWTKHRTTFYLFSLFNLFLTFMSTGAAFLKQSGKTSVNEGVGNKQVIDYY